MSLAEFHEIRFPTDISRGARGGPTRRTDIVTLASGREQRNARWAHSRRRFDAGYGIKTITALQSVIAFFEERRGRLIGFRWRDRLDWSSASTPRAPLPGDQPLGLGAAGKTTFQLAKSYGDLTTPYVRPIRKPVAGTVRVAVGGVELAASGFSVNASTGMVTFAVAPATGAAVTAGFEFDVPVRFDTDELDIELSAFEAGQIPRIPLIELVG